MAGALGVNQRWLFTGVFALGALLAGLGGALAIPREPASLEIDLVRHLRRLRRRGGRRPGLDSGRLPRRAADRRDQGVLHRPRLLEADAGVEFIVMAVVLVLRPWGLLGRPQGEPRGARPPSRRCASRRSRKLACVAAARRCLRSCRCSPAAYALVLLTDILVFALFAVSLHFLMGPGGMTSFGHAAYFGLGAYARRRCWCCAPALPMELALAARAAGRRLRRAASSAGSACGCRASTSRC